MSLQLAAASYIYIHYSLKKNRKRVVVVVVVVVVAKVAVHKEGSVQRFEFAEFSVGQWVV